MGDCENIAGNVASAIVAAMDWSSSPDARKAAVSYLESIKGGDIRVLANISFVLIKRDWSSEIRMHGYKMLQHLVRLSWDEFTNEEKINFANAAISLISEMVDPREEWALKSQTTALVAEVVRREGLSVWQDFLPLLISMSSKGPIEAEMVAMLLRWIPEDITVHNEDLEGDRRRALLRGLTQSLPEILPLLYNLLEKHFGVALEFVGRNQFDIAKQHATTVTAILNAINAYAEWAPVSDFQKYGLIQGCGFLLSSHEYRLHACEFFKHLSQRKRPTDAKVSDFDSAISSIIQILLKISGDFLIKSSSNIAGIDENEVVFMECICESMVSLATSSLQCISRENATVSLYIQQMLGYFQHFKFAIHFQSLPFWLLLLKGITPRGHNSLQSPLDNSTTSNSGSGSVSVQADSEKKALIHLINDDICAAILDLSFQRLQKRTASTEELFPACSLELWSDDFDEKVDFGLYRSKLLEIIKLIVFHKPLLAVTNISKRINSSINGDPNASPINALSLLECWQPGLETIINATFDETNVCSNSEKKLEIHRILEGLLQQFMHSKTNEPAHAIILGRYLNTFGPFLKCFPDSVGIVVNKLFELLTSLPLVLSDPSTNNVRLARLQICTSFIRIAKVADKSLLPHMKGIADTMSYLETEGCLLRSEHNLLAEAFLVMSSSSGQLQKQEILAWLLEPFSKQWTQLEWQISFLSDPLGLTRLCSDAQFMWSIFHTVAFFERALKRSGVRKGHGSVHACASANDGSVSQNPMASHLSWILPPLIKLLRCIHSLWSHQVVNSLPLEMQAAMIISYAEKAGLLGESMSKQTKGLLASTDGHQMEVNADGHAESGENSLRNWLKAIRDSGYNILGMSASIGEYFFQCLDSSSVILALMENVQSMEFRHLQKLVHLAIIPIARYCPPDLRELWLHNLLLPLFLHCQQALSCSWSGILHEGRAKVPDRFGDLSGLDLKVEVMEEKLLRALTREICQLLSFVASPSLNNGIPPIEQFGNTQSVAVSSLKDLDAFASNSLVCFLLINKDLALPVLQIIIEAFSWTDGEAVSKVASFCGTMVLLAISTKNIELNQFVVKDLFSAIIGSLTLESNALYGSDLVELCRLIFVYLSDRDPAPRQILLSVPGIKMEDIHALKESLEKINSPKEQKAHMKGLLLLATGNKFRALVSQRSITAITNVTSKIHSTTSMPSGPSVEDDVIGLAVII